MKKHWLYFIGIILFSVSCNPPENGLVGQTEITKWKGDKKAAISLTYDDGTINQFTVALPIMNELNFPGTFYIMTGKIPGSKYKGKFIGRDTREIVDETVNTPTNKDNFFERASAIGFLGMPDAVDFHSRAGSAFEAGRVEEAYEIIDEGYKTIREGAMIATEDVVYHENNVDSTTWQQFRDYAKQGHEFGSHTITHPRLAVLDEANMLYELEKSREDILTNLGEESTFSAECPYGTENERVMDYAFEIYPALRNRMPATYMEELNRGSDAEPGTSPREYVQWQRGPLTNVPMEKMKAWVDTALVNDNIWLVLVFHGIDGIGWEPRTGEELKEYFAYMKQYEEDLWVATFADVTKYIRERKNTIIEKAVEKDKISLKLTCSLDEKWYSQPLTLKTYVPDDWSNVVLKQNGNNDSTNLQVLQDEQGNYVLFDTSPNKGTLVITGHH